MKVFALKLTFLLAAAALCFASSTAKAEPPQAFDPELASELGADDYGMRRYVMAFLTAGPNQDQSAETAAELQQGHMAHIRSMAASGELVLAGPFFDGGELRGIFLFAVDSIEQAETLTAADPAVQAGRLSMEFKPWYGSAALMKVNQIHQQIASEHP